jgi:DNA-directed RNA polymerase subunit RPC12/RpoP
VTTYVHKFKCLKCGLHFALYSWDPGREESQVFCPECGEQGIAPFMHWSEETDKEVFEFVPGMTPPHGVSPKE